MPSLVLAVLALCATTIFVTDTEAAPIAARGTAEISVVFPFELANVIVDGADDSGIISFPITGGTSRNGHLRIVLGDGFQLRWQGLSGGSHDILLTDLVVDTASGAVFGIIDQENPVVSLFDFGSTTSAGIELKMSYELVTGESSEGRGLGHIGAPFDRDLIGETFGFLRVAPQVVPLPATLPLLAGGLALMVVAGSRRRRSDVPRD